jgi:hypothetical protein
MSAMVVGQGSRKILQEDARARQRVKSIQARLLQSKAQLVGALAGCVGENSAEAQQVRDMVAELNGRLDTALDRVVSDGEGDGEEGDGEPDGAEDHEHD